MANNNTIQIKRGSSVPTTTALVKDGELGYNKADYCLYINNGGSTIEPIGPIRSGTGENSSIENCISTRNSSTDLNQAIGRNSHAEGGSTIAYARNSHAEGCQTHAGIAISNTFKGIAIAQRIANQNIIYLDIDPGFTAGQYVSFANNEDYSYYKNYNKVGSVEVSGTQYKVTFSDSLKSSIIAGWYVESTNGSVISNVYDGIYSHAEGYNTRANGANSHAEGNASVSEGKCSHAEGYSTSSSGDYSHTTGAHTTASGSYSSAQGYYTTAAGKMEAVAGKYNVTSTVDEAGESSYAYIVGGGTSSTPKNIGALTWDGDLRIKGSVYTGCNNDSTGGTEVIGSTKGNWTTTDSSANSYIYNKPHIQFISGKTDSTKIGKLDTLQGFDTNQLVYGKYNRQPLSDSNTNQTAARIVGYGDSSAITYTAIETPTELNEYLRYFVIYGGNYTRVTSSNKNDLGIVPGTTEAYEQTSGPKNIETLLSTGTLKLMGDVYVNCTEAGQNGTRVATINDLSTTNWTETDPTQASYIYNKPHIQFISGYDNSTKIGNLETLNGYNSNCLVCGKYNTQPMSSTGTLSAARITGCGTNSTIEYYDVGAWDTLDEYIGYYIEDTIGGTADMIKVTSSNKETLGIQVSVTVSYEISEPKNIETLTTSGTLKLTGDVYTRCESNSSGGYKLAQLKEVPEFECGQIDVAATTDTTVNLHNFTSAPIVTVTRYATGVSSTNDVSVHGVTSSQFIIRSLKAGKYNWIAIAAR